MARKKRIHSRGEKVGELQVGRGSLYRSGARRQKEKRIGWGKFADLMDLLAYGKVRKSLVDRDALASVS